jgi:hypothetical protein
MKEKPMGKPILTSFEAVLQHPIRAAIVKSILSREDASVLSDIRKDVDMDSYTIQDQLRALIKFEIVERKPHITLVNKYSKKPLHSYRIRQRNESLQATLHAMFPEAFEEVQVG